MTQSFGEDMPFPAPSKVRDKDPFGDPKEPKQKTTPRPEEVNRFHDRSDVDSHWGAQHHTLGIKHDQAAPGDHLHDGKASKKLMEDVILTGSTSGNVALQNLISELASTFGFTDNTT